MTSYVNIDAAARKREDGTIETVVRTRSDGDTILDKQIAGTIASVVGSYIGVAVTQGVQSNQVPLITELPKYVLTNDTSRSH